MNSCKGFFSGEYRLILAVLLIVVVAGTLIFSSYSITGFQLKPGGGIQKQAPQQPPAKQQPPAAPPTILSFTATPDSGSGDTKVTFKGSAKPSKPKDVLTYELVYDISTKPPKKTSGIISDKEKTLGTYTYKAPAKGAITYTARFTVKESGSSVIKEINLTFSEPDKTTPTVSISYSPALDKVPAGSLVTFTADASDNIAVSEINIFDATGNVPPAKTCKFPTVQLQATCEYSNTYNNLGSYFYRATAKDPAGNLGKDPASGANNFRVVDTIPPKVSVSHSPANPKINGVVTITADATDNIGVSSVEIYVDGSRKKYCTTSPCAYSTSFDKEGTHTYYAQAKDAANNVGRDPAAGTNSIKVMALSYDLTVYLPYANTGKVTSNPAGMNCRSESQCTASFNSGTAVTLTATPDAGAKFDGWGKVQGWNDCAGAQNNCALNMDSNKKASATFSNKSVPDVQVTGGPTRDWANTTPSGIWVNTTATSDSGLSKVVSYFKFGNNNTVISKICNFAGQNSGSCNFFVRLRLDEAITHHYWGDATDIDGGVGRDPANGDYSINWPR